MVASATVSVNPSSAYALKVRNRNARTDLSIDVVGYYVAAIAGTFSDTGALYSGTGRLKAYGHSSTGYYTLVADRDLTGCVPVVSSYYYAYTVSGYVSGQYVYVQMTDQSGTLSDYYFSVDVTC